MNMKILIQGTFPNELLCFYKCQQNFSDFLQDENPFIKQQYFVFIGVAQTCSVKKVYLEISRNSQENTCTRVSFLIKLRPATLLKQRLWHGCFSMNFAKFLRTPFLTEHLRWLLLFLFSYRSNVLKLNSFYCH